MQSSLRLSKVELYRFIVSRSPCLVDDACDGGNMACHNGL